MSLAALLAVCLSLGAGGYVVDRSVRRRTVAEARNSLGALLRVSSTRLANDSRRAMRDSDGVIESAAFTATGTLEWLVIAPPGDIEGMELPEGFDGKFIEPGQELARTESFPLESTQVLLGALEDEAARELQFLEVDGEDGLPYRIATIIVTPALEFAGRDRDGRERMPRDLFGDAPRGDDDRYRARRLPRGRREGEFRDGGGGRGGGGGGRWPRSDRRPEPGPRFGPDESYRVFVASPLLEERAALGSLRRTLIWAGAFAGFLSFGLLSLTVRRGLRPVRKISAEISRVQVSRLDQKLGIDEVPAELLPVVQAFEGTRERLAAAFKREKRFTADAAHELRTPLAGLRASLEVGLRRERSMDEYRSTMAECLGVTESMQDMVEALLQLAKGAPLFEESESIRVVDSMKKAFANVGNSLEERDLTVAFSGDEEALLRSHPTVLERIASNVASNAACYATESSEIKVKTSRTGDGVLITVENEAGELDPETAERAFEPLWRGDRARTETDDHAGLGLALVEQCVEALSGTVNVTAEAGRFRVSAFLPDASAARAETPAR